MNNTLLQGFTARPGSTDDLEAVYELMTACDHAHYDISEPDYTLDDIRRDWQTPGHDVTADTWVVLSPEGRIVGSIGIWHREHVRMHIDLRVHPAHSGSGIGRHLLRLSEERARQHIVQAPPHARITLNAGVASVDQAGQQWFEQEGYTRVRRSWRMEIEMDTAPPRPEWPAGITLGTFVPNQDDHAVFKAADEAFIDHWGHLPGNFAIWRRRTIEREDFDPTLWFLARDGDEIAGVSLCEYETKDAGWVDDLAVRRPWRRKGLGMALLLHSFGEFYRRGIYKVGLDVDSQNLTGATRLYQRAGMHITRQYDKYQKELRPGQELSTQSLAV